VRAEEIYKANKDKGLQLLYIISEPKQKDQLPSWEYMANYVADRGLTCPVLRDYKFAQTYGAMKHASTALPHQYILDGQTMEIVMATGGVPQEVEDKLAEMLGVSQLTP